MWIWWELTSRRHLKISVGCNVISYVAYSNISNWVWQTVVQIRCGNRANEQILLRILSLEILVWNIPVSWYCRSCGNVGKGEFGLLGVSGICHFVPVRLSGWNLLIKIRTARPDGRTMLTSAPTDSIIELNVLTLACFHPNEFTVTNDWCRHSWRLRVIF